MELRICSSLCLRRKEAEILERNSGIPSKPPLLHQGRLKNCAVGVIRSRKSFSFQIQANGGVVRSVILNLYSEINSERQKRSSGGNVRKENV